ncbi:hypothetical protein [Acetobacterium tundrae]|uniref:Uncharacterized protein n=1 Tax=Acetobacterium tundrae TaxID=132932 RepID=A0ABR6WPF7_9FIRM|nr:hypothetical protein [Acetobacterium tundrae]MBC3798025.1 hypothetical protein [Acetobacterium tundrae]
MIHRIWQRHKVLPSVILGLRNSKDQAANMTYKFMIASEQFEMEKMEEESE